MSEITTQFFPTELHILTKEEHKIFEEYLTRIAREMYRHKRDRYFVINGRITINTKLNNLEIQLGRRKGFLEGEDTFNP